MTAPPATRYRGIPLKLARQYIGFIAISGTGLMIAVGMLWLLVHQADISIGLANAVADTCAVTFVFLVSRQKIFSGSRRHAGLKYLTWLAWQAIHIMLISLALTGLTHSYGASLQPIAMGSPETLLKIAITPLTMTLNFIVARLLLHSGLAKGNA